MKKLCLVLGLLAGAAALSGSTPLRVPSPAEASPDITAVARLGSELIFEKNLGQWPVGHLFWSRHRLYRLGVGIDRISVFGPGDGAEPAVEMRLEDAAPSRLEGERGHPAKVHYLRGSDPSRWVRDVPTYGAVRFIQPYPGIDLLFYGAGTEHEYDFIVQPGADPGRIAMRLSGGHSYSVSPAGDLIIESKLGRLALRRPVAYQQEGPDRRPVDCRFVTEPAGEATRVRFELGHYDRALGLVIDPILTYASYLGGDLSEQIQAVDIDTAGNLFLAGTTNSTSFPLGPNPIQGDLGGGQDLFVAKLNPAGKTLLAATYLGGTADDIPLRMKLDSQGRPVITGSTSSDDFPIQNAFQAARGGGQDGFVLRLSSNLSQLNFSTYLGGTANDESRALAFGEGGRIWLGGLTRSDNFPLVNAFQSVRGGRDDNFVARMAADGSALEFSTLVGGNRDESVLGLAADDAGYVFATGFTASADYPVLDPIQEIKGAGNDMFLTIIGPSDTLLRSTFLGGGGADSGFAVEIAGDGSIVVGGESGSNNFPLKDPLQLNRAGGVDATLTRLAADGSEILFSTFLGGSAADSIRGLILDTEHVAVVSGFTSSSDFPLVGTTRVQQFGTETFLARIDMAAPAVVFSTRYGGNGTDFGAALAGDGEGFFIVGGTTSSTDLLTVEPFQPQPGSRGVFRSTNGAQNWQAAGAGLADPNIRAVAVAPSNPQILYAAAGSEGIAKSTDGSASWNGTGLDNVSVGAVVVHPTDPNTAFAGTFASVRRTTDGGESWESFSDGLPPDSVTALAIDPNNPQNLYAGTATRGVFRSSDGGTTWSARNGGLPAPEDKQVFSVAVDASDSNRLYLGTNGTVFRSTTGGQLWEKTSLVSVGQVRGLVVDRGTGNVWASGFNNVIGAIVARSTDRGANWLAQPLGSFAQPVPQIVLSLALAPGSSTTLYAGTAGAGVYKTTDGGVSPNSWSPANAGLTSLQIQAVAASSNNTVLAATPSGSDGLLVGYESTNTFYLPQVADGQAGNIRFQTSLILVNTGPDSAVTVEFFGVDGAGNVVPIEFTFPELGTGSVFDLDLKRGQAVLAQTEGVGPVRIGYARVTGGDGVDGTAVFTRSDPFANRTIFEGGVPSVRAHANFVFLLDSLGDENTGVALVNTATAQGSPKGGNAEIKLTLFDEDRNKLQEVTVSLKPGEHRARFVNELFPDIAILASEMRGTLRVVSDQPVAAVTLRLKEPAVGFPTDVPTLTPFPVLQPNGLSQVSYFPQIGHGSFANSIFQTSFILANGGNSLAFGDLDFFDSAGEPMEVTLDVGGGQQFTDSAFDLFLNPNQFLFLKTVGDEPLRVGYARLSAGLGVGGTAVFAETTADSGVTLFEAGVAKTIPRSRFSIFLDSLGKRDTGLAIVNTSAADIATITLRLFDTECNLLGEREIELGPGEHMPRFIFEIFDGIAEAGEMLGVVSVESSVPLAAVTLRQSNDLSIDFPQEVPTLTIFPVIPGIP